MKSEKYWKKVKCFLSSCVILEKKSMYLNRKDVSNSSEKIDNDVGVLISGPVNSSIDYVRKAIIQKKKEIEIENMNSGISSNGSQIFRDRETRFP